MEMPLNQLNIKLGRIKKTSLRRRLNKAKKVFSNSVDGSRIASNFRNFSINRRYKILLVGLFSICIFLFQNFLNNFLINSQVTANETHLNLDENFPVLLNGVNHYINEIKKSSYLFETEYKSSSFVEFKDKRAWILDEYFKSWSSPLYGYGKNFVEACDRYGAPRDCVMVAAVAANETHLCKYYMSWEMKNCWGYGGGGIHRWSFKSIEEAIDIVTMLITKTYGIEFMENPSIYELTFCGVNEPGCYGWGNNVKYFMNQIRRFAIDRGVDLRNI
ncbi:hypothetical protein D6810_02975 [Candidatus Dojkabacteria bacterium]|uniref:Mannosyl-glycoprotein endo-beta-N-acetylglucosamidase-like domain-containing protein n=1 Tax=Candidatus Dojkabacteria bacterium TaxID=2099670 RepID=A0A3M0Z1E7_9BACT|nr:MAG: hypothetical protein D6810_02975 [Candidatus Dojkabacteria bacterium]